MAATFGSGSVQYQQKYTPIFTSTILPETLPDAITIGDAGTTVSIPGTLDAKINISDNHLIIQGPPAFSSFYITNTTTALTPNSGNTEIGVGNQHAELGNLNTILGYNTSGGLSGASSGCVVIGANANITSPNDTNAVTIGTGSLGLGSNSVTLGQFNRDDTFICKSIQQTATVPMTSNIHNGSLITGAQTINIASGAGNTFAHTINMLGGSTSANRTLNLMNTTATGGTSQINIGTSAASTTNLTFGNASGTGVLTVNSAATFNQGVSYPKTANVNQATSTTTAVTSNGPAGQITCFASVLAANGSESFTLNNSSIAATSFIMLQPISYSGNQGAPSILASAPGAGSCTITVRNYSSVNALNGQVAFWYHII